MCKVLSAPRNVSDWLIVRPQSSPQKGCNPFCIADQSGDRCVVPFIPERASRTFRSSYVWLQRVATNKIAAQTNVIADGMPGIDIPSTRERPSLRGLGATGAHSAWEVCRRA